MFRQSVTDYGYTSRKIRSLERINSICQSNESLDLCSLNVNCWASCLHEQHESTPPFISPIKVIRFLHSNFSAHVSGIAVSRDVTDGRRQRHGNIAPAARSSSRHGDDGTRTARRPSVGVNHTLVAICHSATLAGIRTGTRPGQRYYQSFTHTIGKKGKLPRI